MPEALLIIGHGTRDVQGVCAFRELARRLARRRCRTFGEAGRRPGRPAASALAFLEFAQPAIDQAIDALAGQGIDRIVCQPVMLFAANHVRQDIPRIIQRAARRWPQIEFSIGGALDGHPNLLKLCALRWKQALSRRPVHAAAGTRLLLVGRGSSNPQANRSLHRVAAQLRKIYRIGQADACFVSLAEPRFEQTLSAAAMHAGRRIVIQPYFLFDGVLVKQVRAQTKEQARAHPATAIFATAPLGVHRLLIETILDRAARRCGAVKTRQTAGD